MRFTRHIRTTSRGEHRMADEHDREPRPAENGDAVAQLIRTAGRRADPPPAAYERALAAATATWQAKLRRRSQRRWFGAVAASVLIAALTMLLASNLPQQPLPVAGRTDRIIGTVEVKTADGAWTALRGDAVDLRARTEVRTQSGSRAGILLAGGASLRLADATAIVLESDATVRVLTGKVYLDTGADHVTAEVRQFEVITPAGAATDIGTQFEVLYRNGAYRLRVREGRVRLSRDAGSIDSRAGEQVTIDSKGAIERMRLRAEDTDWQWVQSVAPAPDIDEQPLSVLLAWVARETGKSIRFEKPDVERKAETTILHGNIRHLSPLEALTVMLATTDLEHVLLDEDTILIRLKTR